MLRRLGLTALGDERDADCCRSAGLPDGEPRRLRRFFFDWYGRCGERRPRGGDPAADKYRAPLPALPRRHGHLTPLAPSGSSDRISPDEPFLASDRRRSTSLLRRRSPTRDDWRVRGKVADIRDEWARNGLQRILCASLTRVRRDAAAAPHVLAAGLHERGSRACSLARAWRISYSIQSKKKRS